MAHLRIVPRRATIGTSIAETLLWRARPATCNCPALLLVQPDTLLRWHRRLFRQTWRWKSRARSAACRPKVAAETIALIREMTAENVFWGAERIQGELLKLDIRVSKRTVQQYMRDAQPPRRAGQPWATFLRNHAADIWACNFLPLAVRLLRH